MQKMLALSGEEPDGTILSETDGIGLLRGEYICRKHEYYVTAPQWKDLVEEYISRVASAQPDKPVWYRFTELETEEINVLRGVDHVLPGESNPALGLRGMRRARRFPETFEIEARHLVSLSQRYANLHLLLPYVISEHDVSFARQILGALGFRNRLGMMVETPSAVFRLSSCIEQGVEFALMGLNDLSSLTLGINRGDPEISFVHPSILTLIDMVVATVQNSGITSGIAGYYDLALLKEAEQRGIDCAVMHFSLLDRYLGPTYAALAQTSELWSIKQKTRDAIAARKNATTSQ